MLPECVDNSVYSGVMNIDVDFLQLVSDLFTAPEIVFLFHLKNQIFDVSVNGSPSSCFMFIAPEVFDEPSLPTKKCFWPNYCQMVHCSRR